MSTTCHNNGAHLYPLSFSRQCNYVSCVQKQIFLDLYLNLIIRLLSHLKYNGSASLALDLNVQIALQLMFDMLLSGQKNNS